MFLGCIIALYWEVSPRYLHYFAAMLIVAISLLGCTIGCSPDGIEVKEYGSLGFLGAGDCENAVITGPAWPAGLVVECGNGLKIEETSASSVQIASRFGPPAREFEDSEGCKKVEFRGPGCSILFKDGIFNRLDAFNGITLTNSLNGKSLKLPTNDAEIRAVFGRPAKTARLTKPAP